MGGGVAGLGTALGLARAGLEVTVLDRDPLTAAVTPDQAFAQERRGAPQVRHTHGLLARLTTTLRDRFPDVLDALLSAGGVEVDLAQRFGEPREEDARLRVLLARRTTLEWALRQAAAKEPGIQLRGEVAVGGLTAEGRHIKGVRLSSGDAINAGAVIAAGGRRAGVPRWMAEIGVEIPEEEHDTGIVYLTRWYRTEGRWTDVMGGEDLVKLGGDLGYLFYLAVPADRGTYSITMAVGAGDNQLRTQLLDEDAFERAIESLPLPPGLCETLVPDGPVHPMGGLVNRLRRFLDRDGQPLVTGFHAAGDAHTCTNPIYGRGCSLALVQAAALVDAMTGHPDDPNKRATAYEQTCREQTEPWYHLSVQTDEGRKRRAAALAAGDDDATGANPLDRLFEYGTDDPIVGRAILRAVNLLATPAELMADQVVVTRAMELVAAQPEVATPQANRWLRTGLSRDEMLKLTA